MTAIADLKTRIVLETNRDDLASGELAQALTDSIARAIEYHADELFWFNRKAGTVNTVNGTATAALPAGMRVPQIVTYLGSPLPKVQLDAIESAYNVTTPVTGIPTQWAEDEGLIHFYPTPDAVYAMGVYGIADLGVPASSNEWTVEGLDLIDARARIILYRDYLRDPDGMALAKDAETEALTKLRRETRRRGTVPLTADLPVPSGFNIVTG